MVSQRSRNPATCVHFSHRAWHSRTTNNPFLQRSRLVNCIFMYRTVCRCFKHVMKLALATLGGGSDHTHVTTLLPDSRRRSIRNTAVLLNTQGSYCEPDEAGQQQGQECRCCSTMSKRSIRHYPRTCCKRLKSAMIFLTEDHKKPSEQLHWRINRAAA